MRISACSSEVCSSDLLASHDLDIRGAGNLLGDEQSGHIREIGFELYQSMLEEAIETTRAEHAGLKPPEDAFSPQITVDAPILLPEDYVPDLNLRMRSEEHTSELQSLMRISYDVFGLNKKKTHKL